MAVQTFIGRYEIIAELGRGAMGSVFKANDPAVGRIVALKTIHSVALSGAQAAEYRARFYREARASGVLAHPAIVPVFDVGEHEGAPFLVMEFVDGRTLDSAMKKGERFTLDRVCDIGQQLADALGYAHRQGVIHRDIKPANILMTSREVYGSERPRITDFGIAKLAASEITTTGQMLGTPAYMPPEQFTGAPIDGRADLFSLGVILYSLAAGEQPFLGETMTAVSYKVVHVDPIPPSKLNPAIPPALEGVILKCLAKNPAARYQTGEELADDLATLRVNPNATLATLAPATLDPNATLAAAPSSISHPPAHTYATTQEPGAAPAKKPSKPIKMETMVAVALLAVVAAGAGGWFLHRLYHLGHVPAQRQTVTPPAPPPAAPFGTPDLPPAPAVPVAKTPVSAPAAPAKPTPSKPAPATAKPQIATQQTTPPPATNPAPASTPVANTAPPPAAKPAKTTTPPATTPATAASDPHKLDPNANSKFKIELSKFPNGVPLTVEMNKAVYLRFISGDKTDLNNLFVPPGTQTFRVTAQNGGKQVDSNIVSSEFKAKKKKNFKIELQNQGSVPAGAAAPLSPDAKIFVSLSTPLF
ncbi:MAG: serine/threonine-protein kinase [Terracidiphilus sp.]|jgi:serine/threonine-protein kinase